MKNAPARSPSASTRDDAAPGATDIVGCFYSTYAETYAAATRAVRSGDRAALDALERAAGAQCGPARSLVFRALRDARRGLPMISKAHLCREDARQRDAESLLPIVKR